jgi:hypothetical protein
MSQDGRAPRQPASSLQLPRARGGSVTSPIPHRINLFALPDSLAKFAHSARDLEQIASLKLEIISFKCRASLVAHASRVLASASSRSRTFLRDFIAKQISAKCVRRNAGTSTRDACAKLREPMLSREPRCEIARHAPYAAALAQRRLSNAQ